MSRSRDTEDGLTWDVTLASMIALVGGFVLGWMVERVTDVQYWRRRNEEQGERIEDLRHSLEGRQQRVQELRAQIQERENELERVRDTMDARERELDELRKQLAEREDQMAKLQAAEAEQREIVVDLREQLEDAAQQNEALRAELARQAEADLTRIRGIGASYEKRLRGHGITTFRELAELAPEELRERLDLPGIANVDSWVAQAAELADEEAP